MAVITCKLCPSRLQSSLAGITRMEGDLEAASAKYIYVQKLRAYVADLCHMLQVSRGGMAGVTGEPRWRAGGGGWQGPAGPGCAACCCL